ncbi:MAG: translocation/assembly module TamB domain-containing protein [Xanthomonadales bacterium]|nr:translocation/assembly module TamB domain-containing protein [Xanthomonadales bacterium]
MSEAGRPENSRSQPRRALRRWLAVIAVLLLVLVLVVLGGWFWLFHSSSGRDFALAQLSASLPTTEDGKPALHYDRADGVLADTLVLSGLRYDLGDGMRLDVDRATLRLSPGALLGRRLQVESLALAHPVLTLGEGPGEPEPETPAFQWPDINLPLSVAISELRLSNGDIAAASGDALFHVDTLALDAELDRLGHLAIGRFELDSDFGRLGSQGELDFDGIASGRLNADWQGAANEPPLRLQARAGQGRLSLQLSVSSQPAQRVQLDIEQARWTLRVELDRLDLRRWWPDAPLAWLTAQLEAVGDGREATLDGRIASDRYATDVGESRVVLSEDATSLTLTPLVMEPDGDTSGGTASADAGRLEARGRIALAGGAAHAISLHADRLLIPGTTLADGSGATRISGEATLSGTIDSWQLAFEGSAGRNAMLLPLMLQATGDQTRAVLEQLRAGDAAGQASGSGEIQWDPAVDLQLQLALDGFDPSRLHPQLSGRLDGELAFDLAQAGDDWRIDLGLDRLRGELLGHTVRGDGEAHVGPDAAPGELHLLIGGSDLRLKGQAGDTLDLQLSLAPLRLQDLLPDFSGDLNGELRMAGTVDDPTLQASLRGESLAHGALRVGQLTLQGKATPKGDAPTELRLSLRDVVQGEVRLDTVSLGVSGHNKAHRIELDANGERLGLSLRARGGWQQPVWTGVVEEASVAPAERPVWRLQQPADLRVDNGRFTLSRSCLKGEVVSLCAEASGNRQQQTASVALDALPLALVAPWLPQQAGEALDIGGELSGQAILERVGEQLQAELALDSVDGHVSYAVSEALPENQRLLEWQSLALRARLADGRLNATLDAGLDGEGQLSARIEGASPLDHPDAALQGDLNVQLPQLRALSLVEPELSGASARLVGRLDVAGSWRQPALSGQLRLDRFNAEIPALGLKLSNSELNLVSDNGSRFRVQGRIATGEGELSLEGNVDPLADGERGELRIRGERVLASDTSLLRVLVSPDLRLDWHAEQGLRVDGTLAVPEGRLDLERIENSIAPSADVVVVDPRDGRGKAGALPLRADVRVVFGGGKPGEAMRLRGFGFDGRVEGSLAVRERPGRSATGRGTLNVSGKYRAYGQNLDIQRGRLLFANTALDNPNIDVRAERGFDRQTVGLEVGGTALLPILDVYADPPLDQAEALSYLVLGRPLRQASGADGAQLGEAAAAIGGNLLAGKLGDRLGLDIGVADSKALGGAAVSVGKYLSPRLYLGYGVSLFGSGQVVTFKYIINHLWETEIESGRENRVGLNYTLER